MGTRRDARRTAIDILYQGDVTDTDPVQVLGSWRAADREVPPFSEELVTGVVDHGPGIDLLLAEHAEGWTVARMTALDRTILRVAVEELLYRDDVPPSVAISEAVEAASDLSAEESRAFINGVLGRIARDAEGDPRTAPAS
ncbi:MAG TPA: transcription antitermination factor NusB [Actinomycetota bacterium]